MLLLEKMFSRLAVDMITTFCITINCKLKDGVHFRENNDILDPCSEHNKVSCECNTCRPGSLDLNFKLPKNAPCWYSTLEPRPPLVTACRLVYQFTDTFII